MRKKAKDTHYVLHPICSSTSLNHCFVLLRLLPHLAQVIRTPQSVITASDGAERWNRTKMEPGRGSSRASWKTSERFLRRCHLKISWLQHGFLFLLCLFCSALRVVNHRRLDVSQKLWLTLACTSSGIKANKDRRGLTTPDVSVQCISSTNMCVSHQREINSEGLVKRNRGLRWIVGCHEEESCYVGDQTSM